VCVRVGVLVCVCVTERSTNMTTSQLNVSAIRQLFESTSYLEAADALNVMHLKSKRETVTQTKEPAKTTSKPNSSAVISAQSTTDISSQSYSTPAIFVTDTLLPQQSCAHECRLNDSTVQVLTGHDSRLSDKQSALQSQSTDDVRQAIDRAKQKKVLQRIVGMKLEGETLLQAASHRSEPQQDNCEMSSSSMSVDDTKPSLTDACEPTLHADEQNQFHDATIERNTTEILPTDETTSKNEEFYSTETDSASQDSKRHVSERPISLYPQDIHVDPALSASNVQLLAGSNESVSETETAIRPPVQTDNTPNGNNTQVATSRNSYLALTEFVGENFSFLDELNDTTSEWVQQLSAVDAPHLTSPAAATVHNNEHTAEISRRNGRPKSLSRTSIILPNGKILEIIGDMFMFLDDHDEETDNHSC